MRSARETPRFARNWRGGIDIFQVFGELAFHGDVLGGATTGFLIFTVAGLFLRIEHGAGRWWRQGPQGVAILCPPAATTIRRNSLAPSDTALKTATRSAQMVSP